MLLITAAAWILDALPHAPRRYLAVRDAVTTAHACRLAECPECGSGGIQAASKTRAARAECHSDRDRLGGALAIVAALKRFS